MKNLIKLAVKKLTYQYSDYQAESPDSIKLFWWNNHPNVGDALNYDLAVHLAKGKSIEWVPPNYRGDFYSGVGSVIQSLNGYATVWGSGIISPDLRPVYLPKKVLAVRGPLTRAKLISLGIDCPAIYGDPALLFPLFYQSPAKKKYKLGIVPHYVDKAHPFFMQTIPDDVKIINIETVNTNEFIDDLHECEMIVSSSMHGIILSDAYGIPVVRALFSDQILGGDFKYEDYYQSIKRPTIDVVKIDQQTRVTDLLKCKYTSVSTFNVDALLSVSPFN